MKRKEETSFLKNYVAPWKGEVILACKRCRKKLRKQSSTLEVANLKKWMKARGKENSPQVKPHIIDLPCLNICPKGGIVVFSPRQLAAMPPSFSIISNTKQMEAFYEAMIASE